MSVTKEQYLLSRVAELEKENKELKAFLDTFESMYFTVEKVEDMAELVYDVGTYLGYQYGGC